MTTDPRYGASSGSVAGGSSGSRGDEAREQAQEVKGTAQDQARQVQGSAKQQATHVGREAQAQARDLVGQAQQQLREQAQDQTGRLGVALQSLSGDLRAVTEGRTQEAGAVGDYAQQAVQQVQSWADQVDQRGFDGLLDDVQRFARRRPGVFLLSAAAAGFAVGRLVRGARDAGQDDYRDQYGERDLYAGAPDVAVTTPVESDVAALSTAPAGTGERPATPVVGPGGTTGVPDTPDNPVRARTQDEGR